MTGKSTPRLYADLLSYNPFNHGINVLTQLPPNFDSESPRNERLYNRSSHNHELILKPHQSSENPSILEAGVPIKVAGVCKKCRLHVEIELQSGQGGDLGRPCPTAQCPLHHFRYDPAKTESTINRDSAVETHDAHDVHYFNCTANGCSTSLQITTRPRKISDDQRRLLVDSEVIQHRSKAAVEAHPDRFPGGSVKSITPDQVLKTLRTAILGVLDRKEAKNIPLLNSRYLQQLGDECLGIMNNLGFTLDKVYQPRCSMSSSAIA